MPRTIQQTVYSFEELSESAKERARDWWREASCNDEWWDGSFDYIQEVLSDMGFTFPEKTHEGIMFTGFSSQGDGATFHKTSWNPNRYKSLYSVVSQYLVVPTYPCMLLTLINTHRYIMYQYTWAHWFHDINSTEANKYFNSKVRLSRLVRDLFALAEKYPFASAYIEQRGRYCHAHSNTITVDTSYLEDEEPHTAEEWAALKRAAESAEEEIAEVMREAMYWTYNILEDEYDYLNSAEYIDDVIIANGYEFFGNGKRAP